MNKLGNVRIASWMAVILMSGCSPFPAAEVVKPPTRGEAVAVHVEQGPACDGTMADPIWQKCPPWPLGACTSEESLKYKTWAKVLFDGTHVYVGVYCEEPDTDALVMDAAQREGPVFNDDSIEIFLRPDPQEPYCQFAVNPLGTLYDARAKQAAWNSSTEAKASIRQGECWTATLKIPMKEIPAYVGEDQTWTMNVYRSRPGRDGEPALEYSWAIMSGNNYHAVSEFGRVSGVNVPRRAGGVTRVRSTPLPGLPVINRGKEIGGVTVYCKTTFDDGMEGWKPARGGQVGLTDDAVDGKALQVVCEGSGAGVQMPLGIRGSRGLKMALLMKGRNVPSVGVNVFDKAAQDNTTPYGYRFLGEGLWTPILYSLDRFRYNSQASGFVSPQTMYDNVRFFGPSEAGPGMQYTIDNFVIYRGTDSQPPQKVTGLTAQATDSGVELSWDQAADNVAPQLYVISRAEGNGGFRKIAESHPTSYLDSSAGEGLYHYRVFAVDFEENLGPWSDPVSVDSVSDPRPQEPNREETDRLAFAEHVKQVHARGVGKVRKGHATLFGDSLTGATLYLYDARAAFGTVTVNAFGYAGMRTNFGRNKVDEILEEENPEFMFILYGTNNGKARQDIPPAMRDLATIVKACEDRGTVAVLGTIPPRGWSPQSAPEEYFNKTLVLLCRELEIPTGYIFEDFQAAGERKKYLSGDGVHWRSEGMEIGVKAWAKALDQIRFVLRDQE